MPPRSDASQHALEAVEIERLGEHVLHRFANQRVIGNLDVAVDIFLAGQRFGKDAGEQIVGAHALNLRRHFLAALKTQQRERAAGVPAPAHSEQRRGKHGLFEDGLDAIPGCEEVENVGERKTVLFAERNVEAVVGGGGLQFKIEGAAEALAQRESPGLVDARAEGSVNDQLHAAAFVEEALGDHGVLRWELRRELSAPPRCTRRPDSRRHRRDRIRA